MKFEAKEGIDKIIKKENEKEKRKDTCKGKKGSGGGGVNKRMFDMHRKKKKACIMKIDSTCT